MSDVNALVTVGQSRETSLALPAAAYQDARGKGAYIGLSEAARIIRRRRWLIFSVVLGSIIAALIFLLRYQPVYSTTTTVMALPTNESPGGAQSVAPTAVPSESEEASIQTKVELFQSRPLARDVAFSLQLDKDPEFAPGKGGPGLTDRIFNLFSPSAPAMTDPKELAETERRAREEAIVDNLIDHVSVERVARSRVISVTASSTDPVKSARIANRLVDMYIRNQLQEMRDNRNQEIADLSKRVVNIRDHLQEADSAAVAFRRNHGLLSSQPEATGASQANELIGMLTLAQSESAADNRRAAPIAMPSGGISATSTLLTELQQQESILARKQSQLSSFYGPGYPDVVQTSAELSALRTRIAQENSRIKADLASQASASSAKSGTIGAALARVRAQSFGEGQSAVTLRALERNVDAINTFYTTLLNQLNTKLGSPIDDDPDISRISRAPVPDSPSYPLPKRVLAVVLFAALAIGTLIAFVVETMDTKLRTAKQVGRALGLPTLAMIPEVTDEDGPSKAAIMRHPRGRFAESMRNLLIEIETRTPGDGSRVVLVTSPLKGEGKSTVTSSLAAAGWLIGRSVVVVDFDLRRPGISDGSPSRPGIVAYLADRAGMDDLMATQDSRLTVIGVEENADDPGGLIVSPRLPELLAQLRERFDLVILNAPPILPVRDAKTLAEHADASVLVLRWGRTSPEAAATALEIFGHPMTGAVLNRVDYATHANRHYGDAIHYVAMSASEYDPDARPMGLLARLAERLRRFRKPAEELVEKPA
ncbi:GumC family protein [Flavisphingomonas formosensis]|uniref:GumC family protein n=1 Tax=Flavisphingomonas formosensis TaxID=861534 RepID=UPI0012F94B3D|nr:Wzz/FepE/Etk N-terminal domain-containing protein [Sphingomonas formosensis]